VSPSLIIDSSAPGNRILTCPLGSLDGDIDDVRRYAESARKVLQKCIEIGICKPLVAVLSPITLSPRILNVYADRVLVTLLGFAAEAYVPLQAREFHQKTLKSIPLDDKINIGVLSDHDNTTLSSSLLLKHVDAIEQGRVLARDVGGSDPERMAPFRCAQYISDSFKEFESVIKVTVISDPHVLSKEFPLLMAVARGSMEVSRHLPVVVRLEYHSPDPEKVKEK
jgi:leucyl aminopeptidase